MRSFSVDVPDVLAALVDLIRQVPRGQVTTYGDLAQALGDGRAAVWVAKVIAEPPESLQHVAHRVVNVAGEPSRHVPDAVARLAAEGVPLDASRVDLGATRFRDFRTSRPLEALQRAQERLAKLIRLEPLDAKPGTVAAVDVSYRANGDAVAAYVLMNAGLPDTVWSTTTTVPSPFPYVPGYLAYRELPVYAKLLQKVVAAGQIASLLLVDGNGMLHPRRAGIATQLGVLADHPTVGVSKSLLCGKVEFDDSFGTGTGRVVHLGETIAAALPASPRGKKPVYVSPGHRITLEEAVDVVSSWRQGSRLPEPIRQADALSRSVAREGLEGE